MDEDRRKEISDMSVKMDRYLTDDRAKMMDVINKNTESFIHLRETMEDIAEKLGK